MKNISFILLSVITSSLSIMQTLNRKYTQKIIFLFIIFFTFSCSKTMDKTEVLNPYANINWQKVKHLCSTTHMHIMSQKDFNSAYEGGIRHFAITNYYPSVPYTPLKDMRKNQFKVYQEHGVVKDGVFTEGPFYWNKIIMDKKTGWVNELDEVQKRQLPFKIGGPVVPQIPDDIIESPNAEHHSVTNSNLHFNSLGSYYKSGTFDAHNRFKLAEHGYSLGTSITWQEAFKKVLNELKYKTGGGITINHPSASKLETSEIIEMLDFDDMVLGIEIYNPSAEYDHLDSWALKQWDEILSTGRRCWGFCVPDHTHQTRKVRSTEKWQGKMFLLIDNLTEKDCLEAYRNGSFYGAIIGNGLRFDKIELINNSIIVEVNRKATISFISDKGTENFDSNKAIFKLPVQDGKCKLVYVRIEAKDESGEIIFSQPIIFNKR